MKAAAEVSGEQQFIVVGSQSVHAHTDNVPVEVLISKECDLWAKGKEKKLAVVEEALGQRSPYFTDHGFYVDAVEPGLILLPAGWESRLKPFCVGDVTGWCLDMNDLVSIFIHTPLRSRVASEFIESRINNGYVL